MSSAESSEFSTNSRTVVYSDLPGCAPQPKEESVRVGKREGRGQRGGVYVVEAGDIFVVREELCRRLGLQVPIAAPLRASLGGHFWVVCPQPRRSPVTTPPWGLHLLVLPWKAPLAGVLGRFTTPRR